MDNNMKNLIMDDFITIESDDDNTEVPIQKTDVIDLRKAIRANNDISTLPVLMVTVVALLQQIMKATGDGVNRLYNQFVQFRCSKKAKKDRKEVRMHRSINHWMAFIEGWMMNNVQNIHMGQETYEMKCQGIFADPLAVPGY